MRPAAVAVLGILIAAGLAGCATAPGDPSLEAESAADGDTRPVDDATRSPGPPLEPRPGGGEGPDGDDGNGGQDAGASGGDGAGRGGRRISVQWNETLSLRMPLDVVLLGFPEATVDAVQAAFEGPFGPPQEILHNHPAWDVDPLRVAAGGYTVSDLPLEQSVEVRVHAPPSSELEAFVAAVGDDGLAVQVWLAGRLETWGIEPGPVPPLVVLHRNQTGHHYQQSFDNGVHDTLRVVGGHERILVMDLSAGSDPWTDDGTRYSRPVDRTDAEAVEAAVRDAIRFRLLQGPIYPIPVAPCHAVTLVYAVHATGELGLRSGIRADEAFDPDEVQAALEELSRETVHVDVVRLDIPQDDPALWSLVRLTAADQVYASGIRPGGEAAYHGRELARAWIDANWERYHVPHEGCEEYLSLVVWSDTLEPYWYGIAEFDGQGRRFSFSLVPEWVAGAHEPGFLGGGCCLDERVEGFAIIDMLFAHETGHLFGQRHPHDVQDRLAPYLAFAFSTTRTVMSYVLDEHDIGFGRIDQDNWDRNRLGFLAQALDEAGKKDAAIEAGFLDHIGSGQFREAAVVAQQVLP